MRQTCYGRRLTEIIWIGLVVGTHHNKLSGNRKRWHISVLVWEWRIIYACVWRMERRWRLTGESERNENESYIYRWVDCIYADELNCLHGEPSIVDWFVSICSVLVVMICVLKCTQYLQNIYRHNGCNVQRVIIIITIYERNVWASIFVLRSHILVDIIGHSHSNARGIGDSVISCGYLPTAWSEPDAIAKLMRLG